VGHALNPAVARTVLREHTQLLGNGANALALTMPYIEFPQVSPESNIGRRSDRVLAAILTQVGFNLSRVGGSYYFGRDTTDHT